MKLDKSFRLPRININSQIFTSKMTKDPKSSTNLLLFTNYLLYELDDKLIDAKYAGNDVSVNDDETYITKLEDYISQLMDIQM